ncbi:hypothetical protein ANN_19290 [Periplaneta americana]|uniref:Mos1 transposase HTH domain-containing protein n=1 Tax=Periplaneta americana TaxID=6978 RepID=A0ABQ8SA18_PERAM|nr:hypothetical protein ANN_19290 [Periplaneta americana]
MTTFTKLEQRSWIKIEVTRGRSAQECFQGLREACGDAALPYRTVAQWVKAFRKGRDAVQDNLHIGRPRMEGNTVQLLASLMDADRRWTARSSRPKKVRPTQSAVKVMFIVVYDIAGVILHHTVPPRQTAIADYYCRFLQHHLRPALRRKRRHLVVQNPIILHDNARSHTAAAVKDLLRRWQWEILEHPPYSPDMSPCDYDLFTKVKEPLRGTRYNTRDELICAIGWSIQNINKDGRANCVRRLPNICQKDAATSIAQLAKVLASDPELHSDAGSIPTWVSQRFSPTERRMSDLFDGFVEFGPYESQNQTESGELKPANQALVFMIRGLQTNYKQIIGYFLPNNSTPGDVLKDLLSEAIREPMKGLDRPAGCWSHAHMPKQRWTIIQPEWRYRVVSTMIPQPL